MWNKRGLIFSPKGTWDWAQSYALLPTVDVVDEHVLRIYFASLDQRKYGRIGFIDVDANDPNKILHLSPNPILDLGEIGYFDDCGVNPSCILNFPNKKFLYYIGWQKCERVPYMLFAGLAISENGGAFKRYKKVPVLERTDDEPYIRSATSVIFDNNLFKAWYVSAFKWIEVQGILYPNYIIRYAESHDGIQWKPFQNICINFQNEHEFGFGRPWVLKDKNEYKMWYSIRSKVEPYKLGYAESKDGIQWVRKDHELKLYKSAQGWDSEMICYPCVVDINGKRYMFYNGNRHGLTGFGYAIWE